MFVSYNLVNAVAGSEFYDAHFKGELLIRPIKILGRFSSQGACERAMFSINYI